MNYATATGLMALALAATFATGPAAAGECPAGKTGVNVMKPGPSEPTGVTDTVISAIDIGKIIPGAEGRMLRLRKLVIQPGGVVPWHSHAERPANIYVQEGSIVEYRSTCAAPIVHQAGEATAESGDLSHWWRNESGKPVILISSDILPPQPGMKDQHM